MSANTLSPDYSSNIYLAVSVKSSSVYSSTPISLGPYPFVSDVGVVGELPNVKLLSIPKDEWQGTGEDILDVLRSDKENVLRVDVQKPRVRTKRGDPGRDEGDPGHDEL
ncbi:hypothetical protein DFH11DRAFT_1596369 [Phellopilus nigrolimitatus]|nr:hypothetical protein DFH11DRAFT_1596369 [Phellopilus nigrolimitatus]